MSEHMLVPNNGVVDPIESSRLHGYATRVAVVLLGSSMLAGCASSPEEISAPPSELATASAPSTVEASPLPTSAPVAPTTDVYLPNWPADAAYGKMAKNIMPGMVDRLDYSFAIPAADGSVNLDPIVEGSQKQKFITGLGAEVSISIGGYGDDTASPKEPYSREAVLAGWATALEQPEQFASQVAAVREQLAESIGKKPDDIDIDLDFEYPVIDKKNGIDQKPQFTTLVETVRKAFPDADLSIAVPSPGDNLNGYDLPALNKFVDRINVMTYANGANYGPEDVKNDIANIVEQTGDARKIAVGYATDKNEDPLLYRSSDFAKIHNSLQDFRDKDGNTLAGSLIWSAENLTAEHLDALQPAK